MRQRAKCTREDPRHDESDDSVLNRMSSESDACACSLTTFDGPSVGGCSRTDLGDDVVVSVIPLICFFFLW